MDQYFDEYEFRASGDVGAWTYLRKGCAADNGEATDGGKDDDRMDGDDSNDEHECLDDSDDEPLCHIAKKARV